MNLTIRQRVIIQRVAAVQTGDLLTRELWDDVTAKVSLSEEEKNETFQQIPNTEQMLVNILKFDAEPGVDINLEKQERRSLLDALPQFKGYEQGEPKVVRRMMEQLKASLEVTS